MFEAQRLEIQIWDSTFRNHDNLKSPRRSLVEYFRRVKVN